MMRHQYWLRVLVVLSVAVATAWGETGHERSGGMLAELRDARCSALPGTNTVFEPTTYPSLPVWRQRAEWLREQVRLAAGEIPAMPRGEMDARVFGRLDRDGYTIEKVCFASSPGIYVTGNLYRPAASTSGARRYPGVACPHGHWPRGRLHNDQTGSVPARCITLARAGAVVFAYDMVGFNDAGHSFAHNHKRLDTPATALWGIGHFQLQSFNSLRVLDFLQSLPDVDPERIGVTGASGGGTQTFILGAIDDRVDVAAPVNMISSTMQGGCVCENAPCLRIDTNNMEIAALFAPRPMLMVSASGDWTKRTPEVEFPCVRGIYELFGAGDRVRNVHIDAPHNYNRASRDAMYAFFGEYLLGGVDVREQAFPAESDQDMLVFSDPSRVPADWPTAEQVVERKRAELRRQLEAYRPTSASRLRELTALAGRILRHAADGMEVDVRISMDCPDDSQGSRRREATLERNDRKVRTIVLRKSLDKQASTVHVIVGPDGLDAEERHAAMIDTLLDSGTVVVAEPFTTGSHVRDASSTQPEGPIRFLTTFNRTDTAEAMHDVATVVLAATQGRLGPKADRVNVVGMGRMGPMCVLARAMLAEMVEVPLGLVADVDAFDSASDAAYVERLFVPYLQRMGGLPAAAAVAANGPCWLHHTAGRLDTSWIDAARQVTNARVRVDAEAADLAAVAAWLAQ